MFARLMLKKSIEFLDRPGRLSDRWTADKEGEREGSRERIRIKEAKCDRTRDGRTR